LGYGLPPYGLAATPTRVFRISGPFQPGWSFLAVRPCCPCRPFSSLLVLEWERSEEYRKSRALPPF
ncbi:MAG TPA: hypothetical protein VF173_37565, partial [Thermoanaerobaculia bacterium]|nr:hypothetical protein [Thermoanaerobaculia bacterium]